MLFVCVCVCVCVCVRAVCVALESRRVVTRVCAICLGLPRGWSRYIHCDLKPGNVLMAFDGVRLQPKVSDLGLCVKASVSNSPGES